MILRIKFNNNTHTDLDNISLENALELIKHAKLGKDSKREFNLNIKETNEIIRMNHDQISSVELFL